MKEKRYLIFEGCLVLSLIALIAVFQNDLSIWTIVLKSLTSLFFVLIGIIGYRGREEKNRFSGFMLAALICSMAGDVLLALDQNEGILFILGVASFATAHILFSIAFCRISAVRKRDVLAAVLVFACLLVILYVGDFDFQGLLPVLIGYAAVISFMMTKALSLWYCRRGQERFTCLVMTGGVLFLLSDILLLFWLFGKGVPKE
ncbi:MAG: lysoplasmalogenase, partial [Blautia sp.]|nr:lysoplasmalogenase [Blautia sp.]